MRFAMICWIFWGFCGSNLCISVGFLDKHIIDYLLKLFSILSSFSSALNPANFPQQLYMRHCCHGFTAATAAEGRCQNKPLTVFTELRTNCRWVPFVPLRAKPGPRALHFSFHWGHGWAQRVYLLRVLKLPLATFVPLRAKPGPRTLRFSFNWGYGWMYCGSWSCRWAPFVPLRARRGPRTLQFSFHWRHGWAERVYLLQVLKLPLATFLSTEGKAGPKESICSGSWNCGWAPFVPLRAKPVWVLKLPLGTFRSAVREKPGPRTLHVSFHWFLWLFYVLSQHSVIKMYSVIHAPPLYRGGRRHQGVSPFIIRRCRAVVVAKHSFSYPGARVCRRPSPEILFWGFGVGKKMVKFEDAFWRSLLGVFWSIFGQCFIIFWYCPRVKIV